MIEVIDQQSKRLVTNIARTLSNNVYLDQLFSNLFQNVLKIMTNPFRIGNAHPSWCEVLLNRGHCRLPNGLFCSQACRDGVGVMTKCPEGYQPSLSWGFRVTGCWCDTFRGSSIVCCDCTPITNSPYEVTPSDCGCMHFLDS
ncbi:hypothetical protein [Salipaludibacillus daqingensis]|uniref:hypothetical protein n=1 Tax=Salipaludibacillus daqingensis TaxID=3041001 RepID=UPI00247659BD|nr:hypothetical protein [Salipaludibacillus daqingensis]